MKKLQALLLASAAAVVVAVVSTDAGAVVLIKRDFNGNDCPLTFGTQGFETCTVFISDDGDRIELSPVIAT